MKNQFKTLLVIALVLFSYASFSQSVTVVAGGNYTNVAYEQGTGALVDETYNGKPGFHVGAYYDYVISKDKSQELLFEAGLLFDSKGATQEYSLNDYSSKYVTNLYYVDAPFYLQYRYRFRNRNKIYIGAGPYVGMGLFGKTKSTYTLNDEETVVEHKIKWGGDDEVDDLKRLDYGVSARAGYHWDDGFDISASYDYGIPNIASMGENISMKSRVLRLTLGYTFSLYD